MARLGGRVVLSSGALACITVLPLLAQGPDAPPVSEPISDNSFLIEEAYNQEPGVVQHISAFTIPRGGGSWAYSFTQEWPLGGMRHQASYSLPLMHQEGSGTGFGDIALNYRYQLVGDGGPGVHLAPRFTLLLPTGSETRGRGAGGMGVQMNLPFSVRPHPLLAMHANAGLTLTPTAHNSLEERATTLSASLGGSAIWLLRPSFNVLVELLWQSTEVVVGPSSTRRFDFALLNPGVRWAFDFASGLQIVPGAAYTVALDSRGSDGLFLYLSFEHPFRH